MTLLPCYVTYNKCQATPFKQLFTAATDDTIDLISKLLLFNPNNRLTSEQALTFPYFTNEPLPTAPLLLPRSQRMEISPDKSPPKRTLPQQEDRNTKRKVLNDEDVKRKLEF